MYCVPLSVTSGLFRNTVVLTEVELYPSPTFTKRCAARVPKKKMPIKHKKMRFIVYILSTVTKIGFSHQKKG